MPRRAFAIIAIFWFVALQHIECLSNTGSGRRSFVQNAATAALSTLAPWTLRSAPAFGDDVIPPASLTVPKSKSVVVLGAGGRTGRECVASVLGGSRSCIATSRSGNFEYDGSFGSGDALTIASADVTSLDSLSRVIASGNVGAVIFAASASTKGGAYSVDRDGVLNTARCCIANNVDRLVVVSSGTVTRPDSAVYQLLNTVGRGIMEAKIGGEDGVREMYADPAVVRRGLGYTIVRPGGLTTGPSLGPTKLELNQGDSKSGRLSRADVAEICVKCLDDPDTFDTTFECYEAETAKPIETVGLSNILKSRDPTTYKSGYEQRGETWEELFKGLTRDEGHEI